jgi:hypothetical protein
MAQSGKSTPFFNLPLELREQIYKDTFRSKGQGPELLRTCWKINTEARKFLYQRQIEFANQLSMYRWSDMTPGKLRSQVTDISLHVQDPDLRSILDLNASASRSPLPGHLLTWGLYTVELRNLKTALSRLPNVKTITIRTLPGRQSYLYRDFLTAFLDSLDSIYPTLSDLTLEGNFHHQRLDFVSRLAALQSFSFDGSSASSVAELGEILGNLEHLRNFSLISQRVVFKSSSSTTHPGFTGKPGLVTGHAMRTIEQLAFTERATMSSTNAVSIPDILNAVQRLKGLKSFSVSLSHTPDNEVMASLGQFLSSSTVERLELDWLNLHAEVLEEYSLVQRCIKKLWVRVGIANGASNMLSYVLERRRSHHLEALREVVLIRCSKDTIAGKVTTTGDRKDSGCVMDPLASGPTADNLVRTKRRLEVEGVRVAWHTEDA